MKEVNEYTVQDYQESKLQALKIAMATISDVYHEVKDSEEISETEICKVKKAIEVIHIATEIKL